MKEVRPTSGKVKLALFNILGELGGAFFLDLFSGTGQITQTALQRGVAGAVAVETDRSRMEAIKEKIKDERFTAICLDVRRALPQLLKKDHRFDVVFADPPYELGWGAELPKLLHKNQALLKEGGLFVLELSVREQAGELEGFEQDVRLYGQTQLVFYKRSEPKQ